MKNTSTNWWIRHDEFDDLGTFYSDDNDSVASLDLSSQLEDLNIQDSSDLLYANCCDKVNVYQDLHQDFDYEFNGQHLFLNIVKMTHLGNLKIKNQLILNQSMLMKPQVE